MESTREITTEALLAHSDWVRRLVCGLVLDPARAEDVLQETWLVALERPPRHDLDLRAWLATVARNTIRNLGRGEGRRRRREQIAARLEALPSTVDVIEKARLQGCMVEAVLALDEPYRSSVLLRFFEDLPPREIARRLGRPVSTVHSHIARGLERLRVELDREYGEREAWGLAFLPLLCTRGAPALHGSVLLKTGGWIMLLKWMLPLAAAVVALVVWGAGGEEQMRAGGVIVESGEPPALVAQAPTAAPREVGSEGESRRTEAAEGPIAGPSAQRAVELQRYSGRVVDLEGRPRRNLALRIEDPTRPELRGGRLYVGGASVELPTALREKLQAEPEVMGQLYPGLIEQREFEELLADLKPQPARLLTDREGAFAIDLPFARGEVSVEDPGLVILGDGLEQRAGSAPERVYVVAATEALEGRCVDADGVSLSDVRIDAGLGLEGLPGFPLLLESGTGFRTWRAFSGAQGRFRFESLPSVPGLALVTYLDGYAARGHTLGARDRPFVELVMERDRELWRVTGQVVDLLGLPAEGASVVFGQHETSCDERGSFEMDIDYLPEQEPLVAFTLGSTPAVLEGLGRRMRADPDAGLELQLRLGAPTRSISGQVVDERGAPVAGAQLYLFGGRALGTRSRTLESALSGRGRSIVRSDVQGRFEFDGLFEDRYGLVACDTRTYLAVRAEGVTPGSADLQLVLDPGTLLPLVRGRVVDRRGRAVPDAVLSAMLTTFLSPGSDSRSWQSLELGRSDSEGRFELHDVPAQGVGLRVTGSGIEPTDVELAGSDPDSLEIMVSLRLRFQLEGSALGTADSFEVLDEGGERLRFWALLPGGKSWIECFRPGGREVLPTFEVVDRAAELILLAGGKKLRRISLDLRRGEVVRLR